jgi:hypothetical protein
VVAEECPLVAGDKCRQGDGGSVEASPA